VHVARSTNVLTTQAPRNKADPDNTLNAVKAEPQAAAASVNLPFGILHQEPLAYGMWTAHQSMALNLPVHRELPAGGLITSAQVRGFSGQRDFTFNHAMEQDEEGEVSVYGSPVNNNVDVKDELYEESTGLSENTNESVDASVGSTEEARNDNKFRKKDWLPGQNVFDAASSEQRRLRNQKKDPSVIDSLREDSKAITQDELVMDRMFSIQRIRNVYDDPSEAEGTVCSSLWLCETSLSTSDMFQDDDESAVVPNKKSGRRGVFAARGRPCGSSGKTRASRAAGPDVASPEDAKVTESSKTGRRGRGGQRGCRGTSTRGRGQGRGRGAPTDGSDVAMQLSLPRLPTPGVDQDFDRSIPFFPPNREHDLFKDHGGPGRGEGWTSLGGLAHSILI
jgi:hypothetical protein